VLSPRSHPVERAVAVGVVRPVVVVAAVRPAVVQQVEPRVAVRQPAVEPRPVVVPQLAVQQPAVVRRRPERRVARSGSLSWPG
jgi:hypothetical protein